jgi:hypothetical protein
MQESIASKDNDCLVVESAPSRCVEKTPLQKAAALIRARRPGSKRLPKDHPWRRKTPLNINLGRLIREDHY